MQIFLFLAFIGLPILEIALFIKAGQLIGVLPTIAITIATAIAGSFLMRVQGFAALNRFTEATAKGEMPVTAVIDGIGILLAGLLLLLPGLFTDAIGLLLFIPPLRRGVIRWLFRRGLASGRIHVSGFGTAGGRPSTDPRGRPGPRPGTKPSFRRSDTVIDAEFETIEPEPGDKPSSNGDASKKSPWRRK